MPTQACREGRSDYHKETGSSEHTNWKCNNTYIVRNIGKMKGVQLHVFADASKIACCAVAVAVAVVEHVSGV